MDSELHSIDESSWDDLLSLLAPEAFASDVDMDPDQAPLFSTDELVLDFLEKSLPVKGEAETMTAVFNLFQYWEGQESGPNIPALLFRFYVAQESVAGGNLDLHEIQAGLAFKSRIRLWDAFLEIATEPSSYDSLESEDSRKWLRMSRSMKASLLRRQDRLKEAQDLLADTLSLIEQHAALGDKLESGYGFYYYEAAYLAFMIGEWDEALSLFSRSSDIDTGLNDQVGGAISLCLEFRVRYLLGKVSASEFSTLLHRMIAVFQRNTVEGIAKRGHAKRWIWGCWAHQLEISVDVDDSELAEMAFKELQERSSEFPNVSFLQHYEGMYAMTQGDFREAVNQLTNCWTHRTEIDDPASFKAAESKSQVPYLIGRSYLGLGKREEAEKWFRTGAEFPVLPGNHTWNARAASALRLLHQPLI